jgi:hypothetical protein
VAGTLHMAARRLNASVAGATGMQSDPSQAPGARVPTTPTELTYVIPSEFGDLTSMFGGGSPVEAVTQYAPVNTSFTVPAGSVPGRLGGRVPDFRNTTNSVVNQTKGAAQPVVKSLQANARDAWQRARDILKI